MPRSRPVLGIRRSSSLECLRRRTDAGRPCLGRLRSRAVRTSDAPSSAGRRSLGQVWSLPACIAANAVSTLLDTFGACCPRARGRADADAIARSVPVVVATRGRAGGDRLDVSDTPAERFLVALVTVQGAAGGWESAWSTSTPTPRMPASQTASSIPLPVLPATWKSTSTSVRREEVAPNCLPVNGSLKAFRSRSRNVSSQR